MSTGPTRAFGRPWGQLLVGICVALCGIASAVDAKDTRVGLGSLSLEELLGVQIAAPSRIRGPLAEAPATVIVLSRSELEERGYSNLSQMLDDLPGMEVVRPYGATYFKNYWRGWRNTIGEPFLLQLDGMELNHLYFRTAEIMAVLPISSIDQVEIVYGPSSSAYGANAFMGVINVVTLQPLEKDGHLVRAKLSTGSATELLAEVYYSYRQGKFSIRLDALTDSGDDLAEIDATSYEYSRVSYQNNPDLWGGLLSDRGLAPGAFRSPRDNRGFDLRLGYGKVELGLSYSVLESGYGLEYASDRAQKDAPWSRPHLSAHLRGEIPIGDFGKASTLLRYRSTNVDHRSIWIESVPGSKVDSEQRLEVSYWSIDASSFSLTEILELELGERVTLNAGIEVEGKKLQKAYDISVGPSVAVEDSHAPYPLPPREPVDPIPENRVTSTDIGGYLQGRFKPAPDHALHLGLRHDDNSEYGGETTLRAGYVFNRKGWGLKLLYGEAFQEPSPRVLYGGWTGSGSDPDLVPERSRTFETSLGYTHGSLSAQISAFHVENEDTIVNTSSGAANLGDREVTGLDVHLQTRFRLGKRTRLKLWAYWSELLTADERKLDDSDIDIGKGAIGDLADHRLLAGLSAKLGERWTTTLLGRWVSSRDTIETNPVARIPSYAVLDAVVRAHDVFFPGLGLDLRIENLLNEEYAHPGVREADAGTIPGRFGAEGVWQGSQGFFSSLLPQPGRSITVTLRFER